MSFANIMKDSSPDTIHAIVEGSIRPPISRADLEQWWEEHYRHVDGSESEALTAGMSLLLDLRRDFGLNDEQAKVIYHHCFWYDFHGHDKASLTVLVREVGISMMIFGIMA